ncbi:MAG: Fic family protein [Melioribacteraceae bacterium]|nr:Fic family protein [Melioribacteraceae bacterium]
MKNFNAGYYNSQGSFKSFQPEKINRRWIIEDIDVINLLSKADRQIGRLDMYSEYIPNIDLFIKMHIAKEATKSNKIEGTKTNIEEALLRKEDVSGEKRDDWVEVQNYIEAMKTSIEDLRKIPFSTRMIKNAHSILLKSARGEFRTPGEFRRSQNWVGGATIDDAVFVPPVHTTIDEYMGDLENFIHDEKNVIPDLLKIALIHYQFETIHPFLDGNGRIGRLMITLYLVDKKILKRPVLYLSDFFEKNRGLYYENLTRVRENNEIEQWFKFFLVGVIETAENCIDTLDKTMKLRQSISEKLNPLGARANKARIVVDHLFSNPIIDADGLKQVTKQSYTSVYKLLQVLEELNILREVTGGKRRKRYVFKEYLNLF